MRGQRDYTAFVGEPRFNSTFRDPERGCTVSYADCGDPQGTPVLFCLPSLCASAPARASAEF